MKKTILTTLVLMAAPTTFAQSKASPDLSQVLARKTVAGYQKVLDSEELKTCRSQGEFKRLFTNSCTEFLALTETAIAKMEDSLRRYTHTANDTLDMNAVLQRPEILVMSHTLRITSNFVLSAEMEAMETGDAKEQAEVVVQRLKEDIKEIKTNNLK